MRLFYLKIILLAGCLILGSVVFVVAQEDPFSELTYPVPELGNCSSRTACEFYCDKPENMEPCLDFAEVHNLLPQEEIEMARRMLALGITEGPGGCEGQQECETYCDKVEHIKECIIFAEKNNLIPPDELAEAKKVIQAIDKGLVPPKCKGKKECDIYCSKPENMAECITFGEAAGLIPPDEMAEAKKMLEAIKKGVKPPACQGKEECDIYCSQPEHMEECMAFAIAAGFMPAEDIENAKKTLEAIKKGVMPPNCRGEEECNVYCSQPEHQIECINFAEAAGFMTPEDAARARKMAELGIVGGPGGCQGEEECNAFCQDPANMETCINFSVKTGDMSQEEADKIIRRMRALAEGGPGGCKTNEECNAVCQNPATPALTEECINFAVKLGDMTPEDAQQMLENIRMMQEGSPSAQEIIPSPTETPPSTESPQSFFNLLRNFLANLISF